jgi:hypothetical protein
MATKTRGLSRDANNEAAQFLTKFQCYDAAGTRNSSPLAYTDGRKAFFLLKNMKVILRCQGK